MADKKCSPEQAVVKLRQIDVLVGEGKSIHQACKDAGITDVTYYRWRKEYGGLKGDQARRLKELERENQRLKRIVDDVMEVAPGLPPEPVAFDAASLVRGCCDDWISTNQLPMGGRSPLKLDLPDQPASAVKLDDRSYTA